MRIKLGNSYVRTAALLTAAVGIVTSASLQAAEHATPDQGVVIARGQQFSWSASINLTCSDGSCRFFFDSGARYGNSTTEVEAAIRLDLTNAYRQKYPDARTIDVKVHARKKN